MEFNNLAQMLFVEATKIGGTYVGKLRGCSMHATLTKVYRSYITDFIEDCTVTPVPDLFKPASGKYAYVFLNEDEYEHVRALTILVEDFALYESSSKEIIEMLIERGFKKCVEVGPDDFRDASAADIPFYVSVITTYAKGPKGRLPVLVSGLYGTTETAENIFPLYINPKGTVIADGDNTVGSYKAVAEAYPPVDLDSDRDNRYVFVIFNIGDKSVGFYYNRNHIQYNGRVSYAKEMLPLLLMQYLIAKSETNGKCRSNIPDIFVKDTDGTGDLFIYGPELQTMGFVNDNYQKAQAEDKERQLTGNPLLDAAGTMED